MKRKKKFRVGLDCRLAGVEHAGIGRYTENILTRLPQLTSDVEWVYFFSNKKQSQYYNFSKSSNVLKVLAPIRHYSFAEQTKLYKIFAKQKLDLLHVPHFNVPVLYSGKVVVTIHDLLWHERKGLGQTTLPSWQYWVKYLGYRFVANRAIKKATTILVPTKTIQNTLAKYYPKSKNKITVTKEGVDSSWLKNKNESSITTKKQTPYLLYVGSLYPHKNVNLILKALQKLPNYNLKIVSARNAFVNNLEANVKKNNLEDRVTFTGFLRDSKLKETYKHATALVQPSFSEGFGLTGIEAMASGTPVIASDIPIFREVYEQAALFFNPHSEKSFVKTFNKLDATTKSKLLAKGKKLSAGYDWKKTAKNTLEVYKKILPNG